MLQAPVESRGFLPTPGQGFPRHRVLSPGGGPVCARIGASSFSGATAHEGAMQAFGTTLGAMAIGAVLALVFLIAIIWFFSKRHDW